MTALVLTLREEPPERLDLSGLLPDALGRLNETEMMRLPVGTTRAALRLGDCFAVRLGDASEIRLEGGSSRLDRVGEGLAGGTIRVEGDVGQRLGAGMRGGEIRVAGSAGPFAGTAASGGLIVIAGDADERAGGAVHGAMAGLDGATLVIRGRAGARLGDRMRRGLVVAGSAGDLAGARMIGGTIAAGAFGDHPGFAMRRGTLLARSHGTPLPSFVETGTHRLVALRLVAGALRTHAPELAEIALGPLARRAGDLATLGKGELLIPG